MHWGTTPILSAADFLSASRASPMQLLAISYKINPNYPKQPSQPSFNNTNIDKRVDSTIVRFSNNSPADNKTRRK